MCVVNNVAKTKFALGYSGIVCTNYNVIDFYSLSGQ